jgi:PEP-CTERM motif
MGEEIMQDPWVSNRLLNARPGLLPGVYAASVIALLSAIPAARAAVINVVDVIPNAASAETGQNSEPSLAVDPLNPNMMISGAFSTTFVGNQVSSPYWISTNGGATWSGFGSLLSVDKSLAWRQDGLAALTTTLNFVNGTSPPTAINTFQSGGTNFGSAINTFNPGQNLDQPWIRTGPSGQTYVAYNNLSNGGGRTASMIVSGNNGSTYGSQVTLETVNPTGGQDAPSVRQAVNGSTVYAAFTRWGAFSPTTGGDIFSGSQVVVVKSTNSGASFNAGVSAATTTGYFSTTDNSPLTLGQQRTGSDVAIAVDPNNANHVLVAYGDRSGAGQLQLHVTESTDGGTTWTNKLTTSSSVRSALPAITILADGQIGLLYASYDPVTNSLSQHLVTTSDDFATTTDSLLGTESNTTPISSFDPYLGDFYDLTSVGDTMYGIFSASNEDNGLQGSYQSATFQRCFTGTENTASFALCDNNGHVVPFSIDPFVFSFTSGVVSTPEPATLTLLGTALIGLAALRRRRR